MIIDAHTHIFPPAVRRNRDSFFKGEPEFQHIYSNPKSVIVGKEELIHTMDENGVDVSVTFGFPWRNPETARMHNDYVLESMERYPGRLWGLTCIHPLAEGAGDELNRGLKAGMKGVGELAVYFQASKNMEEMMKPVADVIRDFRTPLLLHTNETVGHTYPGKSDMRLKDLYRVIQGLPDIPIILAHWGGGIFFYELMKKEVPDVMRNVYYDTAASPFLYRADVYDIAVRICGEHKVVFGSDYPLIRPQRYFQEMQESGLTPQQINKICGENIKAVFQRR